MKLGDKFIKNQDEYIKELQALLAAKEEENASLKKEISDNKIEHKSKINALNEINNDLKNSIKNLKGINDNLIKTQSKLKKQLDKKEKQYCALEKKNEMNLSEMKKLTYKMEVLIEHLVNSQLMTRKAIEELYGPSSEKTSKIIPTSENVRNKCKEDKPIKVRGRKKGTQNFSNRNTDFYNKIIENMDLPTEYQDPASLEVGTLISERYIQKIHEVPAKRTMVLKKVGMYQLRDGTTFEIIFNSKDPFGFSACTPSFASYLTYLKCALYLPNDRIEHMFEVQGTPISKQLQYSYLLKTSEFFKIAFKKMHKDLLTCNVLHADETAYSNLSVAENKTNYTWAISSPRSSSFQAVCYFYKDNRKYENAEEIFAGFKGTIVSDRYKAYELDDVKNAFCWSHARRKYTDIIKHLKVDTNDYNLLKDLIEKINKIFHLEKSYAQLNIYGDKLLEKRNKEIKPVVDDYFKTIKDLVNESDNEINLAFKYSINGENGLRVLLTNPLVDASNNLAENVMRKVAKIRDNSLFSATTEGAHATMILLSIVQSCILNFVNPEKYVQYYLENYELINDENVDKYLPYSTELPKELYFSKSDIEINTNDLDQID